MVDGIREGTVLVFLTVQLLMYVRGLFENDWTDIADKGTIAVYERRKGARSPRGLDIAGSPVLEQRGAARGEATAASS